MIVDVIEDYFLNRKMIPAASDLKVFLIVGFSAFSPS